MCDVISVVAEFMLSVVLPMHGPTLAVPSVMCDVISVAAEFKVNTPDLRGVSAFSVWTQLTVSTGKKSDHPRRNAIGHTHDSASSGAKA
jgi:hypothetical protein